MPALNFKKEFADLVQHRVKRQTIRAKRRYPIRQGDPLFLYTGMRTKSCRKLTDAVAKEVSEIRITESGVKLDGIALPAKMIGEIARADGFHSISEFKDFFQTNYGFPFSGQLIRWD
jgi:hypothetical protein